MENNVTEKCKYLIKKSKLEGAIKLSGAKNSILRLLAASLLSEKTVHIENYPNYLLDAQIHVEMLKALGKSCVISENEIIISEKTPPPNTLTWKGRSIRNTLLILGALVARNGKGAVPLPGGCPLGERKFDLHEMLLKKLGAKVSSSVSPI